MSKDTRDNQTVDLVAGKVIRQRGRPAVSPLSKAEQNAERQRRRRARLAQTHATLTVELPLELVEQFNEWLKFKDYTQNAIIEKLIRGQLLRKR